MNSLKIKNLDSLKNETRVISMHNSKRTWAPKEYKIVEIEDGRVLIVFRMEDNYICNDFINSSKHPELEKVNLFKSVDDDITVWLHNDNNYIMIEKLPLKYDQLFYKGEIGFVGDDEAGEPVFYLSM